MESQNNLEMLNFYQQYRDSFIRMKEIEVRQSEQRIRFFLALVTAIVAFIGILTNASSSYFNPFWVAAISLPILFIYGILTYSQIIWSSHVIHNLDVTRGILDDLIKEIDPILKIRIDQSDLRKDSNIVGVKNIKGTFSQYMYITQCLLVTGFIFLIGLKFYPDKIVFIISLALLTSITIYLIMRLWGRLIKNGARRK